jgi:hypothetical protein
MTPLPPSSTPSGTAAWRILFRMLSAFLAVFSFAFWAAAGWNKGWTKTQIPITQTDEVTGIEYVTYQDHFMPGVELFGLALIFCLGLFAITFIRLKSKS